jgi:putative membrane protein
MRVIKALAALCFVVIGVLFGALNRQHVHVDAGLGSFDVRLGFLILVVALVAAFLGGVAVMAGVVWPMRRKLRASSPGDARHSGPVTAEFPALRDAPLREPPR